MQSVPEIRQLPIEPAVECTQFVSALLLKDSELMEALKQSGAVWQSLSKDRLEKVVREYLWSKTRSKEVFQIMEYALDRVNWNVPANWVAWDQYLPPNIARDCGLKNPSPNPYCAMKHSYTDHG